MLLVNLVSRSRRVLEGHAVLHAAAAAALNEDAQAMRFHLALFLKNAAEFAGCVLSERHTIQKRHFRFESLHCCCHDTCLLKRVYELPGSFCAATGCNWSKFSGGLAADLRHLPLLRHDPVGQTVAPRLVPHRRADDVL